MSKLKTETRTEEMKQRIKHAFDARFSHEDECVFTADTNGYSRAEPVFEHDQWWVSCDCGAQWSVHDAEGGDAVDGFGFEQVSEGAL